MKSLCFAILIFLPQPALALKSDDTARAVRDFVDRRGKQRKPIVASVNYENKKWLKSLIIATLRGRYLDTINIYNNLNTLDKQHPKALYMIGRAHMGLYQPEQALPFLLQAKHQQYLGPTDWPSVQDDLDRIARFRKYLPRRVGSSPDSEVTIFSDHDQTWLQEIVEALPEFAKIGRSLFNSELPPVRLFIFADDTNKLKLMSALHKYKNVNNQRGMGVYGAAVLGFNKTYTGATIFKLNTIRHELFHSWAAGYIMKNHGAGLHRFAKSVTYLDEGLAEYVADSGDPDYFKPPNVVSLAHKLPPDYKRPSLRKFGKHKYFHIKDYESFHYSLSAVFVKRMLGDYKTGLRRIPILLDALVKNGNHNKAWKMATGKNAKAEFRKLVEEVVQKKSLILDP